MEDRTPEQQAQFDAAEIINQSKNPLPASQDVVLEVQNIGSESKSETIK